MKRRSLLKFDELDAWLIIKGLACYMLFGNPSEQEKQVIVKILTTLEQAQKAGVYCGTVKFINRK